MINSDDKGIGKVKIGNNVFIGVNSVVLRNVSIGDNSIIGAGSLVNIDIPEGVVAAGNPIKIIKEIPKPYNILPKKH
jgi:acetyltransferase-like isoleucine patch superfamily enzyme